MVTSVPPAVPPRVRQLATDLAESKPMRRGSLSERTIKCSTPGCACAQDPKARHGPYHSLTHAVEGKTRSRFLTAEQAPVAHQQQIDAGRKFRAQVDAYWEACEEWADAQLADVATSSEEVRKWGSKRTSRTKSSGIRDPSGIRPRLKVPLLRIPAPSGQTSPNAYCAKPRHDASRN